MKQNDITNSNLHNILPGIVFRCKNDAGWTMLQMSDKVIDILGYSMKEVNKITFNKIINTNNRDEVRSTINQALEKKQSFKVNYSVTTKSGKILWLEEYGKGVFENENAIYIEGYIHDITEQVQYKKENKKQLKILERAEDLGLTGNWEFDLNTNMVYTSKGAQTIYELEDKVHDIEFVQKIPLSKYRKPLDKALKQLVNGAKPYNVQFEIKGPKTGTIKTIESIAEYSKTRNAVFGVIKDITVETKNKQELIATKDKFRMMTVNSADCIWQMDKRLNFTYLSPALFDIFGYKPAEWIGTPLYSHTSWIHFAKMARLALRTLNDFKNFKHVTFESYLFNKEKELIPVEIVGKPLLNSKGKLIGLQGATRDIRNRKAYREEIKQADINYKTLYDNVPNGIATFSSEGKVLVINENAAQNMGGEAQDFLGKTLWDFLDKQQADLIFERLTKCFQTGEKLSFRNETQVAGKAFAFLSKYAPVFNLNNEVISVQISSTDISELQNAHNQLKLLKHRLEIANQSVINGVWDWNLDSQELYWDDLMYSIYGVQKGDESLNYQNWENAVLPEDLDFAKQKINEAIETKGILDFQFRINHSAKGIRYIKAFAKYVELDKPHLIGVNYDNTERVESRKRLAQSEQQFRKLFEDNNDIIAILSPQGTLLNINSKGLNKFEIDPKKMNEFSFANVTVTAEDEEHSANVIKKVEKHIDISPYYKKFSTRGGKIQDFEVSVSPLYDNNGKLIQIVSIIRDITERIEYENELLKQTQKAQESDRLKSAFLMNMSHEIRTPLNGIMGFTDILGSTELDPSQKEYIEHVQKGSNRLLSTVNDLLEASQIQQNQFKISLSEVDLADLISEVYYYSKERYKNELQHIDFFFNSNIADKTTVQIDASRLKAILVRIIDNAFKFTTKGSITFECLKNDSQVEINIKDTGAGIKPEKLKLIFDFFRQGDESLTRGYEGLGLGLPIAKGILELMNATIDVISEPELGTNISIGLPLNNHNHEVFNFELPETKKFTGDCSVLLVEDDEHSSRYIEIILKDFQLKVSIARDGRSCKSLLNNHTFNIVFVDLKLPDVSGLDLIPLIRSKLPDCHIVVQSAFANQGTIEQAINLGANDYLTKPVNKKKMIEIVKQFTNGNQ